MPLGRPPICWSPIRWLLIVLASSANVDLGRLLLDLLIVLGAAKLAAELAERLRVAAVLGEIAAGILLGTMLLATAGAAADLQAERLSIDAWRAERVGRLTSDTGWLTLAGLLWLKEGDNSLDRKSVV